MFISLFTVSLLEDAQLINELDEDVLNNLDDLYTKAKSQLLVKLIEYRVPKINLTHINIDNDERPVIVFQNVFGF